MFAGLQVQKTVKVPKKRPPLWLKECCFAKFSNRQNSYKTILIFFKFRQIRRKTFFKIEIFNLFWLQVAGEQEEARPQEEGRRRGPRRGLVKIMFFNVFQKFL